MSPRYGVLGEAPGQVEDRRGLPFQGPAGQFMRRSLRRVMLRDSEGCFLNAVSCFPKANKTPTPEEIAACKFNLFSQLDVIPAKYILVCGGIALKTLLPSAELTYATGIPVWAYGKCLYPIYHPAYVLRTRAVLEGWERQLMWFGQMVDDNMTPQDVAAMTVHCFYCSAQHENGSLTCEKHRLRLRKDKANGARVPIPVTMNPNTLF